MACRRVELFAEQSKSWSKSQQHGGFPCGFQPGTDAALQDLTSVIGREPVLSLWCGRRRKLQAKSCSMARTLR